MPSSSTDYIIHWRGTLQQSSRKSTQDPFVSLPSPSRNALRSLNSPSSDPSRPRSCGVASVHYSKTRSEGGLRGLARRCKGLSPYRESPSQESIWLYSSSSNRYRTISRKPPHGNESGSSGSVRFSSSTPLETPSPSESKSRSRGMPFASHCAYEILPRTVLSEP